MWKSTEFQATGFRKHLANKVRADSKSVLRSLRNGSNAGERSYAVSLCAGFCVLMTQDKKRESLGKQR
jgi:hypothetical protein